MKPKCIILVRHGESEGNVSKEVYQSKPDYALRLTERGMQQAFEAGVRIAALVGGSPVRFYTSPFWRARQTYQQIRKSITNPVAHYEDSRLREQDWGKPSDFFPGQEEVRDQYGPYYYQFRGGESCANVEDRISSFLDTFWRDFDKMDTEWNAVVVCHGMTVRCFLKRWFHWSVEEFEHVGNPKNGEEFVIALGENGKYTLQTELRKRPPKHSFQFAWEPLE